MLHAKLLSFFSIFLFFCISISAQNFSETQSKISSAVKNRDYQTAVSELENLEKSDGKIFALNNYDYLLARMAEKQGDFGAATANYQAVTNRNSVLSEYALWHLSQIFRSSGNLFLERIYLQKLIVFAPESLLSDAANARLANSYFESKDFASTIRLIESGKSKARSDNKINAPNSDLKAEKNQKSQIEDRETLVLLGQCYLQTGKFNEATEIFTKLTNNLSNPAQPDDYALAGAKALDEIAVGKENFGKIAPTLAETDHYRRASIFQFNRNFALARLHYKAIAEKYPASNYVAVALYQIGRGFAQEKTYEEAINWFERVQAEFPNDPIAADALSQTATAYSRVNKPKEAISRYQRFIAQYPNAENLDRAYLNIVDVLRDTGENSDALKWTAKTREAFRGKSPEAIALFAQVKIHIAQNDWTGALNDLSELETMPDLGGANVPGGTNKAEIIFLKGFVLENLNRYAEAIEVYLSIYDGRNEYYGWRATERLNAMAGNEKTNSFTRQKFENLWEISKENVSVNNAKTIANAARSAIRLLTDAEKRNEIASTNMTKQEILLNVLRKSYALLPEYQKVPDVRLLEFGRKEIIKENREISLNNPHQNLADELLFLELYDEATPELEISKSSAVGVQNNLNDIGANKNSKSKNPNPKSDFDYTLAVFYERGEMANRAIVYIEPLWKNMPFDYQIELIPREQMNLLYPTPYSDSLLKYAAPRKVDPRFALSIMRQESRYRADVKSNAAARGLMQFISTTSDKIAVKLNRENFEQDELYNPPTAILFGSQYLSDLFKIFPDQPFAVAASFNGGEDNMTRWFARAKSENPDRYVPEIVFSQSKDYAYKVMTSYRVYQTLYEENLKAR